MPSKPRNKEVETKRQRNQKWVKKQNTRQKDEPDPTESGSDAPKSQPKKVRGGDADRSNQKQVRNKREKETQTKNKSNDGRGATNRSTKENEKKRPRQGPGDQPTEDNPTPKKRKVLVNTGNIQNNIRAVFTSVGEKLNYTYKAGDQSAETTLKLNKRTLVKQTANNIHAEMGVLEDALGESLLTITEDGKITVKSTKQALKPAEFKTTNAKDSTKGMDHCGYCTFFLTLMNVPTGRPTFQTSVQAGAQNIYPLPKHIRENPAIIARALGYDNATKFINETLEGIEGYYEEGKNSRIRDKSDQEMIVEKLKADVFTEWKKNDNANQGAEKRFNSLLDDVFGHHKPDFLNSLWNPVITELTTVMKKDKNKRKAFLEKTK